MPSLADRVSGVTTNTQILSKSLVNAAWAIMSGV